MSPARKAFIWVFLVCLGLGVAIGVGELVAPDAVSVSLNDQDVTAMTGFVTSSGIGGALGLFFGLIIAGIVKLATRGSKSTA